MKRTLFMLLVLVMAAGMLAVPAAAVDGPTFSVSTAEAAPGEEVSLTVSMENNPGIAAFGLNVLYDEDVLEWTGVTKGDIGVGTWSVGVDEVEIWYDMENYSGDCVILTLTFKVKEDAPAGTTAVSVSYDPDDVCDEDLENVTFAVVSGGVTVVNNPVLDVTFNHSTSLGSDLSIVYYVPTSYLEGCDNVRLHVEKNKYNADGTYTVSEYDITEYTLDEKNGVERFRFVFRNIAAKEMGDDVRATIRAEKDGVTYESAVDVYSVKIYAMNQLGKTSNAKFRTLLVDLLNYGAQAQTYFNYNTANLANADLTAAQQAYGTAELGALTSCESTTETPGATARFSSKSVVLGNEIVIKYYMKFDEGQSLDNVRAEFTYTTSVGTPTTVSFAASEFDYDSANDRYTVRLQTIAAKDAGQPVTARIYDGDTLISEVLTYSIETYAYNQLQKESLGAGARAIITAMMKFCKSAEAYF